MKRKVKSIARPQLDQAVRLTALQLNGIRLDVRHTVLTPDRLVRLAAAAGGQSEK